MLILGALVFAAIVTLTTKSWWQGFLAFVIAVWILAD